MKDGMLATLGIVLATIGILGLVNVVVTDQSTSVLLSVIGVILIVADSILSRRH